MIVDWIKGIPILLHAPEVGIKEEQEVGEERIRVRVSQREERERGSSIIGNVQSRTALFVHTHRHCRDGQTFHCLAYCDRHLMIKEWSNMCGMS